MSRLRCAILILLTAISALLSVASGVMWFRSYRFSEGAGFRSTSHFSYELQSLPGSVCLEVTHEIGWGGKAQADFINGFWVYSSHRRPDDWPWEQWHTFGDFVVKRWGFILVNGQRMTPVTPPSPDILGTVDFFPSLAVAVPYWFLILSGSFLPILVVRRRWLLRRRRRLRLCLGCGFDLRATPDRCPECGTVSAGTRT